MYVHVTCVYYGIETDVWEFSSEKPFWTGEVLIVTYLF